MNDMLTFFFVASLLVISPGPNGILIFKTASSYGRRASLANILGLTTATFFHGALSIFGLSALFLKSDDLFMVVKISGAAYLFYIGIKSIYQSYKGQHIPEQQDNNDYTKIETHKIHYWSFYAEGFLTQILNPKVSMFYLAAFPQFISFSGSYYANAFTLVTIHAGTIFFWFIGITCAINKIKNKSRPSSGKWIQRISGTAMIYFSILLINYNKL